MRLTLVVFLCLVAASVATKQHDDLATLKKLLRRALESSLNAEKMRKVGAVTSSLPEGLELEEEASTKSVISKEEAAEAETSDSASSVDQPGDSHRPQAVPSPQTTPSALVGTRPQPGPSTKTGTRPQHRPGPQPGTRPQLGLRPQTGPHPQPRPLPQPRPHPQPASLPQPRPRPQPGTRPQLRPRPQLGLRPQTGPHPQPRPLPQPKPLPQPRPHPQPATHPQPRPRPQPGTRPQPRPQPGSLPHPGPRPQPESHPQPILRPQTSHLSPAAGSAGQHPRPQHQDETMPLPAEVDGSHVEPGRLASIPNSILASVLSSPHMKAAPLTPDDLSNEVAKFGASLQHVVKTLHQVASDVRDAADLMTAALKLDEDMQALGKAFIPAQREAAVGFFRIMVYGLSERKICDLNSDVVEECVLNRLQVLAVMLRRPLHMDDEVDKLERCNKFFSDPRGGKDAVASDVECLADGVSKLLQLVEKMRNTANEAHLAAQMDAYPMPKLPLNMEDVNKEVSADLESQFEAILSEIYRLMIDVNDISSMMS